MMARLLRDACEDELQLPRLEGLTPVQIFLEMGLARLRRKCMDNFIGKGYFESVYDITSVFDICIKKDPQDQADALFLLYNGVLMMNIFAQHVLMRYSSLKLSPTAEGVTAEMIEKLNFTVDSNISFADVSDVIRTCKIPKIWKSEVTIETSDKQDWLARGMVLCSREDPPSWIPSADCIEQPNCGQISEVQDRSWVCAEQIEEAKTS
ncbi:unnamed protein product [Gongylonema pulchrum]|uniref:Protein zwilch n=1 Tax=Gongylonema pulchrum TaxID=637853 RepID=A0A183D0P2_9BILA|nr:unnamed protein product [Gongylonema pulchrum]